MANIAERWYFTKEKIRNSPSVLDGIEQAKELGYRQQCANLIQDIGQRLQVNQLVINTAIVYMHRFYMFHSFNQFHRNTMASCLIFLAAKVEELPRKLEHVLKASHICLHKDDPPLDIKSDEYCKLAADLVNNESVLLQTLGFEVSVDHPNTYVVKCAQLVKASKELAQTAYFLATNSLHLTTFCIQYKPTIVACVCIYVSCLWANYLIPETDGKNWYEFIDNTTNKTQIEELSSYFITILDSCPTRLKRKLTSGGAVVMREGKIVAKKEAGKTSSTDKNEVVGKKSEVLSKNIPSKTHLTGLLKPQSHEATPPPSRPSSSCSNNGIGLNQKPSHSNSNTSGNRSSVHTSHSYSSNKRTYEMMKLSDHRKSDVKNQSSKNISSETNKDTQNHKKLSSHQLKTPEQIKADLRKNWTPEQIEEYKKKKEKERQLYKKRMAENGSRDHNKHNYHNSHNKQNILSHDSAKLKAQNLTPTSSSDLPVKKSRYISPNTAKPSPLNHSLHKANRDRVNSEKQHRLTSSGSEIESASKNNSSRYSTNTNTNLNTSQIEIKSMSPPPPPPIFGGNRNKKDTSNPPPPPSSHPKYV